MKEPIIWTILEEKNGMALIFSDKILDAVRYNSHGRGSRYSESYIREWLNNDFYNEAFNDKEKIIIHTTEVDNSLETTGERNNDYISKNTRDKVFLLSVKDVKMFLKDESMRKSYLTEYAKKNFNPYANYGAWFLRSPIHINPYNVYGVTMDRYIQGISLHLKFGVRPAIWIILQDCFTLKENLMEMNNNKKSN